MMKLTAVVLMLMLPGLVAADINRLPLGRALEQSDALLRTTPILQQGMTITPSILPMWAGPSVPVTCGCSRSRVACPASAPQHVTRCLQSPDCRETASAPILWPQAPRVEERKTAAKELSQERPRAQESQPAQ